MSVVLPISKWCSFDIYVTISFIFVIIYQVEIIVLKYIILLQYIGS
jgi:hypothetical protein